MLALLAFALAEDDTGDSAERPEWTDTGATTTEVFVQEPAGCAGAVGAGLAVGAAVSSLRKRHAP